MTAGTQPETTAIDGQAPDSADGMGALRREGLVGGVVAVALGNAFAPAVAAAITPIMTHVLGVDGQGVTTGATAPLLLAVAAATIGIPSTVTYAVAKAPTLLRGLVIRAAALTVLAGTLVTVVVIALRLPLSGSRIEIARLVVLASLFIVPNLLLGVVRAAALGLQRWRLLAVEQIMISLVLLCATLILLVGGWLDVTTATLVTAATPIVGFCAYIPMRGALSRSCNQYDPLALKCWRLPRYALRMWIGAVTGILLLRVDQMLMVPLSGAHQLGLYTVAVSVSEVMLLFNGAVANVLFSADAADNNTVRLARAGRISTAVVCTGSVVIAAVAYFTLGIVFGPGFSAAFPAVVILLLAVALANPGSVAGAGLAARGHPGLRSIALTVACVINLGIIFVLVPPFGAVGAALASLVGNLIAANLAIVFLWRQEGISPKEFYGLRRTDLDFLYDRLRGGLLDRRLARGKRQ